MSLTEKGIQDLEFLPRSILVLLSARPTGCVTFILFHYEYMIVNMQIQL